MAKTVVQIELSSAQEIALMNRFGRKCSPETLVRRALAEVLRQQAEDVPVFEGKEAYEARIKAEAEAKRLADAEASKLPPAVEELIARFKSGEKFVDLEGREISALEANEAAGVDEVVPPLIIQVDGENSEWFPVALDEVKLAPAEEIPDAPDAPPNLDAESAAREDFNA